MISDRAKRLVLALHEPFSNEQRWIIAQRFLDEERAECEVPETFTMPPPLDFGPTHDDVSGRIAQTLGQNEEAIKHLAELSKEDK